MNTNKDKENDLLAYLILTVAVLLILCLIGCAVLVIVRQVYTEDEPQTQPPTETESQTQSIPTQVDPLTVILGETPDAGMKYIDKMIFFGESTTAHLRARGVLTGGTGTKQVWADASGTRMLSSRTTSEPILYPETGESLTISEACAKAKPEYIVLCFGLNGINGFIQNKNSYVSAYNKLIGAIHEASPETKIILQTVYPVADGNGSQAFGVEIAALNANIDTLNSWLPEIAAAHPNVRFADTASVLKNADGSLGASYNNGDGIHLSAEAYEAILAYLRTHAWQP